MVRIKNQSGNNRNPIQYLSPLAAWALAFGCMVGWGSFVMPGTTFLPAAGPLGTVIGLVIGGGIMLIISVNYGRMMNRYPDAGGSYAYARIVLGSDHGFLCAWILLLAYVSIIWSNATALSLFIRYLVGDTFSFGYLYSIAGYDVYFGEVLLSIAVVVVALLLCVCSRTVTKWAQIFFAVLLFGGIVACFIAVVIHNGGFSGIRPLFKDNQNPVVQVMGIVILAPWAYFGFDSISHSTSEFRFSVRKSLPIMIGALVTGVLAYAMLTVCASMACPDGFSGWPDYIASLGSVESFENLPTFYNAREAMGDAGLALLSAAAIGGVATGALGSFVALNRLMSSMAEDGMLPRVFAKKNKRGLPAFSCYVIAGISCLIPLLGRTSIGWIVDIMTVGGTIVYAYVSVCAYKTGKDEKLRSARIWGIIGAVFSVVFALLYLMPNIRQYSNMDTASYLILILWSLLGLVVFRVLMQHDKAHQMGKSEIVWIILFVLILVVSLSWIHGNTTDKADAVTEEVREIHMTLAEDHGDMSEEEITEKESDLSEARIRDFSDMVTRDGVIQSLLILAAILIIFSIVAVIKKRQQQMEADKLTAEEKSRAKSQFLSNMSHDIRTPMNAITGYTALALREKDIPENLRVYLEKIQNSGKQMVSLINDILDMSQIESGKLELHTAPVDLRKVFDEALSMFTIQMRAKKLKFFVDTSRIVDRYVICDKKHLNRIILNLVSNAYKFTPSGGKITVVVEQLQKRSGEGTYELSVTDTGIGMSPAFTEHIFDSFERERTATVSQVQGAGLGMSITKSLVELMGGSITVETEKDKGTKFTIRLRFPLSTAEAVEEFEKQQIEEQWDFSGYKLLVVEDNAINLEIACAILQHEGFETDTAENGQIAVDMIAAADPDTYCAVLMDIQMPVMDGYEAARAIRALDESRAHIPIIAVTANSFAVDRQEAIDAGMNAHVAKPFDPKELVETIAKIIL